LNKVKVPIEFRDIYHEFGGSSVGKIGFFVELIPIKIAK